MIQKHKVRLCLHEKTKQAAYELNEPNGVYWGFGVLVDLLQPAGEWKSIVAGVGECYTRGGYCDSREGYNSQDLANLNEVRSKSQIVKGVEESRFGRTQFQQRIER